MTTTPSERVLLFTAGSLINIVLAELGIDAVRRTAVTNADVKRWVGYKHLADKNRHREAVGLPLQDEGYYDEVDVRRAVAYVRVQQLIGAGIGKEAQRFRDRVRSLASTRDEGFVVISMRPNGREPKMMWTDIGIEKVLRELAQDELGFMVIPCYLESL